MRGVRAFHLLLAARRPLRPPAARTVPSDEAPPLQPCTVLPTAPATSAVTLPATLSRLLALPVAPHAAATELQQQQQQ